MAVRKIAEVRGLDNVLKNLNDEIERIKGRTLIGLLEAGKLVRREGQILTPVDTGNLINSWYGPEKSMGFFGKVSVTIGLTASYAPYVHEMINAKFKKPGAQAKFLETPLKELSCEILKIIRKYAKIKK